MYCEGRGMMEDRVKALKTANIFEEHVYCHILSRPQIKQEGTDTYIARTNFSIFRTMYTGETETFATGRYLDTIRCTASETLFLEKLVVIDSRRIDTLLVLPI
jgi:anthranilate 1,2-dioxygenase small subunit